MTIDVYTIRMGLFDTRLWTPTDLLALYKADLKTAGFASNQLPQVEWPNTLNTMTLDDPFPGAKRLVINLPPFGELSQTRDTRVPYAEDPMKLADAGKGHASVFTWNLCLPNPPAGVDGAGLLRDIFRRIKPEGTLKLTPKVSTWESAPELLEGYPPKGLRPECGGAPAPAPSPGGGGGGKGKVNPWLATLAGVLGAYLLKKGSL